MVRSGDGYGYGYGVANDAGEGGKDRCSVKDVSSVDTTWVADRAPSMSLAMIKTYKELIHMIVYL